MLLVPVCAEEVGPLASGEGKRLGLARFVVVAAGTCAVLDSVLTAGLG